MSGKIAITIGQAFVGAEVEIQGTPYKVVELDLENTQVCVRGPKGLELKNADTLCGIEPCYGVLKLGARFEYFDAEYIKVSSSAAVCLSALKDCGCTSCVEGAVDYFDPSVKSNPYEFTFLQPPSGPGF